MLCSFHIVAHQSINEWWLVSGLLPTKRPVMKPQLVVVHVSQTDPCCLCEHYQTLCSGSQSDCARLSSPNKPQDVMLPDRGVSCVPAEWSSSRHWQVGGSCSGCPPHTDRRENLCSRVNSPLPDHTHRWTTHLITHTTALRGADMEYLSSSAILCIIHIISRMTAQQKWVC